MRDLLTVYIDGDEVPGLLFYGLCAPGSPRNVSIPVAVWPDSVDRREFVLYGDHWQVQMVTVALPDIPPPSELERGAAITLKALIEAGCVVAWMAFEGNFCDPPSLFLPECMTGGVITALSASGNRWNRLDLEGPIRTLTDQELLSLRAEAGSLASVE